MREWATTRRGALTAIGTGVVSLSGFGVYQTYGTGLPTTPTGPDGVTPRIIGHRGAADLEPENTVRAIERAAEEGADGVEIDFAETRDGVLVALHDPILDVQTTGTGLVSNVPYSDLESVRVQGTEPIPTIDDVLQTVQEHDLHLVAEIKADEATETVMDTVRDYGWQNNTTIVSFDHPHLIPALDAGWTTGLLGSLPTPDLLEEAVHEEYDYVLPHFFPRRIGPFTENAWETDITPGVWSLVAVEHELRESLLARPEMVITNRPDIGVRLRSELYE